MGKFTDLSLDQLAQAIHSAVGHSDEETTLANGFPVVDLVDEVGEIFRGDDLPESLRAECILVGILAHHIRDVRWSAYKHLTRDLPRTLEQVTKRALKGFRSKDYLRAARTR